MFEVTLPVPAKKCFDEFVDLRTARLWLPGLKRARVVRTDAGGRPLEVFYEFGEQLAYALVYAYDDTAKKVRWVPSSGVRDGVSGSASFEEVPAGCRFTYTLDSLRGREADHETQVAQAFVNWVRERVR
ncbi:MAG: hypothetical protein U0228_31610 [Myxococcaceae bacterium]